MSEELRKRLGKPPESPPWKEIRFRCSFHNTIYDVLKARGFKETEEPDWDLFWCDKEWIHDAFDHTHLQAHQRVNHFRNHFELTRKDLLVKNIRRAQRQAIKDGLLEEAQAFAACSPTTFVLPQEYSIFVEEFKRQQPNGAIWIMKPVGKSQGRGIFLFDKLSQVSSWRQDPKWMRIQKEGEQRPTRRRDGDEEEEDKKEAEPYVVQRYLSEPLLIGGKKFDLRLYVLVTSYSPLTIYVYRSGFARFSHSRFSMNTADLSDAMIHLTNVAVQKHNDHYDEKKGGKWDLRSLKMYLMMTEDSAKVQQLFAEMQDVILFSLLSVQKVMIQDKHCFELYGYDIMISKDLKPWLIEVNASPSLSANTVADYEMKFALLDDVLTVLDFEKYLDGTETQIGGFDILCRQGVRVDRPATAASRSYLGCHNNRQEQMRRLSQRLAREQEKRKQQAMQFPTSGPGIRRKPRDKG
mmetsp:Transcript_44867/g.104592  ORF Transcript_44867/g.104592 Transcript_44867/m.104592 type:complete len:465 (+) Transcript_44867:96-1490(+)